MDNPIREQLAEDLQKAKVTGKTRATRIKEIVQSAAAQAVTEVKAGSGEVRSIAQNRFQTVIETVHDQLDRQTSDRPAHPQVGTIEVDATPVDAIPADPATVDTTPANPTTATTPVSLKTLLVKLLTVAKVKFLARVRQEYTDLPRQYDDLKQQATQWDAQLTDRYGDRYHQLKQRFQQTKVWYDQKRSQGAALDSPLVEQKQAEFASKAGAAGTAIAQKEQQVRQQVKDFLQTAASKL